MTRVSSIKPQIVAVLLVITAVCSSIVWLGASNDLIPVIAGCTTIATGLIALTRKVVHRRGSDYRISTLFYSEVATVDDVCMTVTKTGPVWTRLHIHLRRPARFGWTISFLPTDEALTALQQHAGRTTP